MILLAYLLPSPGAQKGIFSLKELANYGISLIFFFYGLRLSPQRLREGLGNWHLHLTVQLATFVLFPLLILGIIHLLRVESTNLIWLGIFFVAALPSTVSSSVVMVSIAGGNIPGAIFNASISALIGVFITPIWMGIFIASGSGNIDLTGIILKLMLQVLLPVILGLLLHSKLGTFAEKHRRQLRYFDQTTILLIVYTAFCESFSEHMVGAFSAKSKKSIAIGIILLLSFTVFAQREAHKRLNERRQQGDDSIQLTVENYANSDQLLDSLKIGKYQKILALGSYSTNIPLCRMRRQGYSVLYLNHDCIQQALTCELIRGLPPFPAAAFHL